MATMCVYNAQLTKQGKPQKWKLAGQPPAFIAPTLRSVPHRPFAAAQQDGWFTNAPGRVCAADTRTETISPVIEGLDTTYCNEFECTSSPAVEQTVRSLVRDIQRLRFSPKLFQPDVRYQDGFRTFQGVEKYQRGVWAAKQVHNAAAEVLRVRMLDKGTAQVEWRVSGAVAKLPVVVKVTSTFELNQLTGRVVVHRDSFDTSACALPAAAAVLGTRLLWSLGEASSDAGEGLQRGVDSLSSFTSMDEDSFQARPDDPTKFFQQQDSGGSDLLTFATLMALLYFAYTAFAELEKLH